MSGITIDLDEPFYSSDVAQMSGEFPNSVGIGGRRWKIDNRSGAYKRESLDVVQQRNATDNRDILLLPQEVWRQSQSGWQSGAGQSNADREDSLPYRFEGSFGVDPWEPWQVSLLKRTEMLTDTGGGDTFLGSHDGKLVVANGTVMEWYDSLLDSSPISASAGSASIISMTYDGDAIITLHSGGQVWRSTGPGASTLFGTFAGATFIEYVKDYLITGIGSVLKDITSGTAVDIFTSPAAGFRWLGATEGLEFIYLIGGSSERWVVHRVGIKDDASGLTPAVVAATLPAGEVGSCIGSYLGFVFVGTSNGVRMATAGANGALTLGSLIPTGSAVYDFEGQGRFVWYTDSGIDGSYEASGATLDAFPSSPVRGLGRMDLSQMTTTESTPAYANDLVTNLNAGTVRSVITYAGKRVFAVNGEGVFYESDEYMEAGWVSGGVVTYGVEDKKTGLYLQSHWEPLAGSVALDLALDGGDWQRLSVHEIAGSTGSNNVSLQGAQFSRIQGRIVLAASDDLTESPTLTRWEVRARPVVGNAWRWTIPILVHSVLEFDDKEEPRDANADIDFLDNLLLTGKMFILQERGSGYQVMARKATWNPQQEVLGGREWNGVYTLVVDQVV